MGRIIKARIRAKLNVPPKSQSRSFRRQDARANNRSVDFRLISLSRCGRGILGMAKRFRSSATAQSVEEKRLNDHRSGPNGSGSARLVRAAHE